MKKIFYVLISFLILFFVCSLNVNAADDNSVEIYQASTVYNDEEYLIKDTLVDKKYSGFINNTIRIYYQSTGNTDVNFSASQYYLEVINRVQGEEVSYIDVNLLQEGSCVLIIEIRNTELDIIDSYDFLNITIYDEVFDISISTMNNIAYENKKIIIDVVINNDSNLYLPDLRLYYVDGEGRSIIISDKLVGKNQLIFTISSVVSENDAVTIYGRYEDVTSNGLVIDINEVSYLTYFDLIDNDIRYCISDEIGTFYIRIPLNSTPDFVVLDETSTITLQKYQIVEHYNTYDLVEMQISLNTECENLTVIVGGLVDEENNYLYKEVNISIIPPVTSIAFDNPLEDINYGDIITFVPLVNNTTDVTANFNWYVNDVLVYTGSKLNYQFYDSGYQYVTVEYRGYSDNFRLYVGYSDNATIVWYILLVVLVLGGFPLLLVTVKHSKSRISILKKEFIDFMNDLKKVELVHANREVSSLRLSIRNIILRCVELAEEVDNTFLDNAISELKKVEIMVKVLPKLEGARFTEIKDKINEKAELAIKMLESAEKVDRKVVAEA